jgi:hypothetical protein
LTTETRVTAAATRARGPLANIAGIDGRQSTAGYKYSTSLGEDKGKALFPMALFIVASRVLKSISMCYTRED